MQLSKKRFTSCEYHEHFKNNNIDEYLRMAPSTGSWVLLNLLGYEDQRSVIVSNKHSIYELLHELPSDLGLIIEI